MLMVHVRLLLIRWWIYFNQTHILKKLQTLLKEFEFVVTILTYVFVEYLCCEDFT